MSDQLQSTDVGSSCRQRRQYTHDELVKLSRLPASIQRPTNLPTSCATAEREHKANSGPSTSEKDLVFGPPRKVFPSTQEHREPPPPRSAPRNNHQHSFGGLQGSAGGHNGGGQGGSHQSGNTNYSSSGGIASGNGGSGQSHKPRWDFLLGNKPGEADGERRHGRGGYDRGPQRGSGGGSERYPGNQVQRTEGCLPSQPMAGDASRSTEASSGANGSAAGISNVDLLFGRANILDEETENRSAGSAGSGGINFVEAFSSALGAAASSAPKSNAVPTQTGAKKGAGSRFSTWFDLEESPGPAARGPGADIIPPDPAILFTSLAPETRADPQTPTKKPTSSLPGSPQPHAVQGMPQIHGSPMFNPVSPMQSGFGAAQFSWMLQQQQQQQQQQQMAGTSQPSPLPHAQPQAHQLAVSMQNAMPMAQVLVHPSATNMYAVHGNMQLPPSPQLGPAVPMVSTLSSNAFPFTSQQGIPFQMQAGRGGTASATGGYDVSSLMHLLNPAAGGVPSQIPAQMLPMGDGASTAPAPIKAFSVEEFEQQLGSK
eukprot:NODE_343_length_2413_cov_28.576565_g318_i0.p1 GENE.NODE_343_length_2413_cov_28.576565_g318_i0~~NODE_343_length_2413_cov_28.576565_g318_i0.p1  ORF type:complete len:542 (-),score=89.02 NODE_343_length_2413_cov_28.576565_g318_i0:464-2089(-)